MDLTQIVNQYAAVTEQLLIKEVENKRLNSYIDQILKVICGFYLLCYETM